MHRVGAARKPDARGQVPREVLVSEPAGPAHLLHDRRALAVSALDALGVEEDREGRDEPDAALLDEGDVLVGGVMEPECRAMIQEFFERRR